MDLKTVLNNYSEVATQILDTEIQLSEYCPIDLSSSNKKLEEFDITSPIECQKYIDNVLKRNSATVAYGGYLENRSLYSKSERFSNTGQRNIHLGMDFWCSADTKVVVPVDGIVHSFKNNYDLGNYGPTIILQHEIGDTMFYTLYGHLSLRSIKELKTGIGLRRGETLGTLGTTDINVNYAPHLHFQIISDIDGYEGDYPGVCSKKDLPFYEKNCPDPNILLKIDTKSID